MWSLVRIQSPRLTGRPLKVSVQAALRGFFHGHERGGAAPLRRAFSGIMGILESAAIECLSINVKPITIEKLSSESLYSRGGGKEAGYFYPLPVCGKRDDVPRVVYFQASLISG